MFKPTINMDTKTSVPSMRSVLIAFGFFSLSALFHGSFAQCTSSFSFGPNDTICTGENLTLTDLSFSTNGIGGWAWSANGSQLAGLPVSGFSAQAEGVYTIQLQAFDNIGTACDPASQMIVVLGNPAVELAATEISCTGACDGGMQVTYFSVNEAAYTSTWTGVGGSAPLTDLCPGIYTAVITDEYGCTGPVYAVQEQLFEPALLEANMLTSTTIQSCPGNQSIPIDLNIQGGTPGVTSGYLVSWSPSTGLSATNVEDPVLSPLSTNMNQTFTASITDDRGCQTTASFELVAVSSQLEGTVTIGAAPCVACEVSFFTDPTSAWTETFSSTTDVDGFYHIDQISGSTNFHLMVDPDNIIYPNALQTYYNAGQPTHRWAEALELNSGCGSLLNKDIPVLTVPSHNGACTIKGTLYQSSTGKTQQEDPIPLIDVVVEKTPPGTPAGRATTNVNGEFEFDLMEASDSSYVIYVNFPGVPMGQTYSITVDANDLLYDNLDLCVDVDSTVIAVCSVSGVPDQPQTTTNDISIYPNPNNGDFTLRTGRFEGTDMTMQLIDVSGRVIYEAKAENAPGQINLVGISAGYYLTVIQSATGRETLPVSVFGF
jgi:hypothetical protein